MKYTHGTDQRKKDLLWIIPNYIAFAVFYLVVLGLCFFLLYDVSRGNKDPLGHIIIVGCVLAFNLGIFDASWRNEKFEISDAGIQIKSITNKKVISWSSIVSCGLFTVLKIPRGMPRDYIVIFLSANRPVFPVDLTYCSVHRRKMLVIRATGDRIAEMKNAMANHQIIWLTTDGIWDHSRSVEGCDS